jgi:hypothetical protein
MQDDRRSTFYSRQLFILRIFISTIIKIAKLTQQMLGHLAKQSLTVEPKQY